ncbi:Fc.00g084840.m01.CDS01 [Cosmosporella sp. VM-42]
MESSKSPLRAVDPQPVRNPSPSNPYPPYNPQSYTSQDQQSYTPQPYNPQDYPPEIPTTTPPGPAPGMAIRPGSDTRIANHQQGNLSMAEVPQRPASTMPPMVTSTETRDIKSLKTNCQFALREYLSLQRQRGRYDASTATIDLEARIKSQANVLLGDLRILQGEVRSLAKEAESHRWRRWIIGGAIASFIPLIRRFWRRGDDNESKSSSNDTEYAFKKSKGLIAHIKDGVLGHGRFAKIAFLVFAVLYVFSNEVSLRVARTTQKRIKKLCARIERGDPDISDHDMKVLEGWRWRVLLW